MNIRDASFSPYSSPAAKDVAVNLEGVLKKYRDQTVLHELSLKINRGEFLTLLGPSGCGKTTLLNLIAGFAEADNGEIFIDGQLVTDMPAHQREIGIVFQNYALFPHMTVERNIGYGLKMRGVPEKEIQSRVKEAMEMVKLGSFGGRKPKELSGGQQQRVALARALVIRPKVLLLDEPFSALDKSLRGSMQEEVRDIQRQLGVTTIFVTHDQAEALSMSDRIAVMSSGRICQIDAPDTLYRNPQDPFVAAFLGDVNILPAHYSGEDAKHIHLRTGTGLIQVPHSRLVGGSHEGGLLNIYARPEQIQIHALHANSALNGTVVNHVFQGDHIDTFIDVDIPTEGRRKIMVRSPGLTAMEQWPVSSVVSLALPTESISVFSAESVK